MLSDEILVSMVILGTVAIPNFIITLLETRKNTIKSNADLINSFIRIVIKTSLVAIISTIIFSLIILEVFKDSDPGSAVAVIGIWMVEALAFIFCLISTFFLLWSIKIKR